jgi:hypothetical protein
LSTAASVNPASSTSPIVEGLKSFRLIPRIEAYPAVVRFAQTIPGKLALLGVFGLGLAYYGHFWLVQTLCVALITFLPSHRRILVTLCTLAVTFFTFGSGSNSIQYLGLLFLVIAGLGALLFWMAGRWPGSWFARHPVLFLLTGFSAIVAYAAYTPAAAKQYRTVWDFTALLSTYIWFIGYSLLDRPIAGRDPFYLQAGSYRPFWGSSNVPFAKGASYLRRIEAKNAEELAVTQLKGLKLLVWSILISLAFQVYQRGVHGYLGLPSFPQALAMSVNRAPAPWYVCWMSLITGFLGIIMSVSVGGHTVIAICRMAGFNALRNTYRPLSSRSVAEFFNRFYFYFKELLVDFFFYPVFLRYFKGRQKLRLAVAIFAAAGFGNALFHFLRDLGFIQHLGLWGALVNFQVFLFYCVLLAAGITISQLRHRGPAPSGFIRGQLLPSLCVMLFYCLLDVFGSTERNYPLSEHLRFFAHLFNLNF